MRTVSTRQTSRSTYQADIRYAGQAFEITVDFTEDELKARGINVITDQFDDEHDQLFSFKLTDGHEILMIRAVVKAKATDMAAATVGSADKELQDCLIHESKFYYDGEWHDAPLYDRNLLHSGIIVPGPSIVMEMDSTTVILPGPRGGSRQGRQPADQPEQVRRGQNNDCNHY